MNTQATELTQEETFESIAEDILEDSGDQVSDPVEEEETEAQAEEETDTEDTESDNEDPSDEEEEITFDTADQIAEALGMDSNEFLASIKANAIIKGIPEEVSLQEALQGYQRQSEYTQSKQALAEERRATEAELTQARQSIEDQAMILGNILTNIQNSLVEQENSQEMQQLMATDPQTFLLRQTQLNKQREQLNQYMQQSAATYHQNKQALDDKSAAERQATVKREFEELLPAAMAEQKLGSWTQETNTQVTNYLQRIGYTPEQIAGVSDHRDVITALKAMKYEEMVKSTDIAKKKVKTLPKLQPKAKKGASVKADKVTALRNRLKKSGKSDDAQALFTSMFENEG